MDKEKGLKNLLLIEQPWSHEPKDTDSEIFVIDPYGK